MFISVMVLMAFVCELRRGCVESILGVRRSVMMGNFLFTFAGISYAALERVQSHSIGLTEYLQVLDRERTDPQ